MKGKKEGELKIRNKYGNKKVLYDDHSFASKLEASVYQILKSKGYSIICQVSTFLTLARIQYIVDFECTDQDGSIFFAEAKGMETSDWRIKRRLWAYYGPGPLLIYKGTHMRPYLHEEILIKAN